MRRFSLVRGVGEKEGPRDWRAQASRARNFTLEPAAMPGHSSDVIRRRDTMAQSSRAFDHVRRFALAFPETREDHPWGESAIKVRGTTFVLLGGDETKLHQGGKGSSSGIQNIAAGVMEC